MYQTLVLNAYNYSELIKHSIIPAMLTILLTRVVQCISYEATDSKGQGSCGTLSVVEKMVSLSGNAAPEESSMTQSYITSHIFLFSYICLWDHCYNIYLDRNVWNVLVLCYE